MEEETERRLIEFDRVHINPGNEVVAVYIHPFKDEEFGVSEQGIKRMIAISEEHRFLMPMHMKGGAARQIQEDTAALEAVQRKKIEMGIPLDTPDMVSDKDASATIYM